MPNLVWAAKGSYFVQRKTQTTANNFPKVVVSSCLSTQATISIMLYKHPENLIKAFCRTDRQVYTFTPLVLLSISAG